MKLYQKYLLLALVILLGSSIYFYIKNKQEYVNRINIVLINLLEKKIESQKERAFSFAYALSQNETLQNTLQKGQSEKAYEILKNYMQTLESFSGSKIHIQIVSKKYVIFARSWDNSDAGLLVKQYRPDLQEMAKTLKPKLSFEAARRLVLIASIPIVKESELIGFVEVIQHFDSIEEYFANYDVDLVVLLNAKYQNQSVLLKGNPRIQNNIVVNKNANIQHIKYLQKKGLDVLLKQGVLRSNTHTYFSHAVLNSKGEDIGSILLVVSQKKLELFSAFEEHLDSFFTYARKDLYSSLISKDSSTNIYDSMTNKELLLLRQSVHKEESIRVQKCLRQRLQNYTKDELISLVLDVNTNKKSRGKIK